MDGDPQLEARNAEFAQAEKRRDKSFFRRALADDLVFRRASGKRVDKDTYIADLVEPANSYEINESTEVESIVHGDVAIVSLSVRAKGKRGETSFDGTFRNTRLWVRKDGEWQCAVWFNTAE